MTLDEIISGKGKIEKYAGYAHKEVAPAITCKDGVHLSVQGSDYHYCTPRNNTGPYTTVEVGYPSIVPPDSWEPYCEDWSRPTDTVYARVPVELVREFVAEHGGEQ